MLIPSVITSSSERSLPDLLREVHATTGCAWFDLFTFRAIDLNDLRARFLQAGRAHDPLGPLSSSNALCSEERRQIATQWTLECLEQVGPEVRIAALATYFPDVTSSYEARRDRAVASLTHAVLMAMDLVRADRMMSPIVEMVCGTILDVCECPSCRATLDDTDGATNPSVYEYSDEQKWSWLESSLKQVIANVRRSTSDGFALALELEPGVTYVLRDSATLGRIMDRIRADGVLASHVGMNVDLAHARIAGVGPEALEPYIDELVHAHIADHPGMHTRDQVVGSWTGIEQVDSSYLGYVKLLMARSRRKSRLPFSGAIAVELEGCNRIRWIHHSISAIKQLIDIAKQSDSKADSVRLQPCPA